MQAHAQTEIEMDYGYNPHMTSGQPPFSTPPTIMAGSAWPMDKTQQPSGATEVSEASSL